MAGRQWQSCLNWKTVTEKYKEALVRIMRVEDTGDIVCLNTHLASMARNAVRLEALNPLNPLPETDIIVGNICLIKENDSKIYCRAEIKMVKEKITVYLIDCGMTCVLEKSNFFEISRKCAKLDKGICVYRIDPDIENEFVQGVLRCYTAGLCSDPLYVTEQYSTGDVACVDFLVQAENNKSAYVSSLMCELKQTVQDGTLIKFCKDTLPLSNIDLEPGSRKFLSTMTLLVTKINEDLRTFVGVLEPSYTFIEMEGKMQEYYMLYNVPVAQTVKIGKVYCCKVCQNDRFYRGLILNRQSDRFLVQLLDHDIQLTMHEGCIRHLYQRFRTPACRSVICHFSTYHSHKFLLNFHLKALHQVVTVSVISTCKATGGVIVYFHKMSEKIWLHLKDDSFQPDLKEEMASSDTDSCLRMKELLYCSWTYEKSNPLSTLCSLEDELLNVMGGQTSSDCDAEISSGVIGIRCLFICTSIITKLLTKILDLVFSVIVNNCDAKDMGRILLRLCCKRGDRNYFTTKTYSSNMHWKDVAELFSSDYPCHTDLKPSKVDYRGLFDIATNCRFLSNDLRICARAMYLKGNFLAHFEEPWLHHVHFQSLLTKYNEMKQLLTTEYDSLKDKSVQYFTEI